MSTLIEQTERVREGEKQRQWIHAGEEELVDKIKVLSLFSGSGGLDLGFIATGKFEVVYANDFNEKACATYKHNIGDHIVHDDIARLRDLPKADVIVGGPPCQGFSTANPARSFDDPRNQLFKEYARIIAEVKPKMFLMENVAGMMSMQKGKVFELIKKELSNCGYTLYDQLMNAKDYGVPQSRRRVIVIGVRNDLQQPFQFPAPTHTKEDYVTVGQTLLDRPLDEHTPNHKVGKLTPLNLQRIQYIPEGGSMKDCPPELRNNSDPNRSMRRLNRTKVSHTIVHNNCDHYYHPTEPRRITIREMARIQGYDDRYTFLGSKSEQSRQVGNSVPVLLAKVLAFKIYDQLQEA